MRAAANAAPYPLQPFMANRLHLMGGGLRPHLEGVLQPWKALQNHSFNPAGLPYRRRALRLQGDSPPYSSPPPAIPARLDKITFRCGTVRTTAPPPHNTTYAKAPGSVDSFHAGGLFVRLSIMRRYISVRRKLSLACCFLRKNGLRLDRNFIGCIL